MQFDQENFSSVPRLSRGYEEAIRGTRRIAPEVSGYDLPLVAVLTPKRVVFREGLSRSSRAIEQGQHRTPCRFGDRQESVRPVLSLRLQSWKSILPAECYAVFYPIPRTEPSGSGLRVRRYARHLIHVL